MVNKILVVGGTGMLGKPVAIQLKKDGFDVSVFSRNIFDARIKMPGNFSIIEGNVLNYESVFTALENVSAIHINLGRQNSEVDKLIEYKGTKIIVKAAKERNIKKVSLISCMSVNKRNTWYKSTKSKYLAEKVLIESGLKYTIFRPSWFMESIPTMIQDNQGVLIGKNTNKYSWLCANDYAQIVSKSMLTSVADNTIIQLKGPEKYTIEEALQKYCESVIPNISIKKMSLGLLRFIGLITLNKTSRETAKYFKYFQNINEDQVNYNSNILLGEPGTTLNEWLDLRIKQ